MLFALPGLHRVARGAEVAFLAVASRLAQRGHDVTLIGSGPDVDRAPYRYLRGNLIPRERFERFPHIPPFRNETGWEESTFLPAFLKVYDPAAYDVTLTCGYPFLNWAMRSRTRGGRRPAHVFVTQNGDWPARAGNSEYRFFGCDGLVCINPDFYEANHQRYRSALIPNGVDLQRFNPGPPRRALFGLPEDVPLVLMVSALIPSKFVEKGITAVAKLPRVHIAVAGDGPLRDQMLALAAQSMPGRYHNLTVTADRMPDLYRSASMFLHLSRDESFGNVYVEAMASGLKTVAWNLPRTRWITGESAVLVPDGDTDALVGALSDTLGQAPPHKIATERAKQFSWDRIAAQYEAFLEDVVVGRSRKQGD